MPTIHFYQEYDPARWDELFCEELRPCIAILQAEGNGIAWLGAENVKAPILTGILYREPAPATLEALRAEAVRLGCVNVDDDGIGCTRHFCGLAWGADVRPEREQSRPLGDPFPGRGPPVPWRMRLRALLGLAPNVDVAVNAALVRAEGPLREAYARVGHATVADMRDRLAEPGDHERRVWPAFEDYRAWVLMQRGRDVRLLRETRGDVIERAWRIGGIDFAEVITRERDGLIREVEFVGSDETGAAKRPGCKVRIG